MGNSKYFHVTLALVVTFVVGHAWAQTQDPFGLPQGQQDDGTWQPRSQWGRETLNGNGQPAAAQRVVYEQSAPSEISQESLDLGAKANAEMAAASSDPTKSSYVPACASAISAARQSCDPDKDGNMINSTRQATQLASGIGQMSGQVGACSGLGQALVGAQGALAGFQANCGVRQSRCQAACAKEMFPQNYKECVFYKGVQGQAMQNVMGAYQMLQATKSCAGKLGSSLAQMCAQNPALPVCAAAQGQLSCNDPNVAATNPTCICQKNPADPRCGSIDSGSQWTSNPVGSDGSGGPTGDPFGNGLGDLMGGDELAFGKPAEGGENQMARGNLGGGGGGLGSGGTGSAGGGAGGRAGSSLNADILKGSYGGRGGGGGGGGSYGGREDQPGSGAGGAGDPSIDLKKFLPGGKMDPSRGLAGVSGPDGITGPNSDIWKKIRTRYYSVTSSMRP